MSRYDSTKTAQHVLPDGRTVVYLRRRFLPPPETLVTSGQHTVKAHTTVPGGGAELPERLDLIAAAELGDPLLFWQICDANRAMRPEDLEVIDQKLRITLPEGTPAPPL